MFRIAFLVKLLLKSISNYFELLIIIIDYNYGYRLNNVIYFKTFIFKFYKYTCLFVLYYKIYFPLTYFYHCDKIINLKSFL